MVFLSYNHAVTKAAVAYLGMRALMPSCENLLKIYN